MINLYDNDCEVEVKILHSKIGTEILMPSLTIADGDVGIDLHACIDQTLTIRQGETYIIPTGIAVHMENPHYTGTLLPSSGLSQYYNIVLGSLTELLDSDYQGELRISCWNRGGTDITIQPNERVAQYALVRISKL